MLNNYKLIVDTHCEVYDLMSPWADGEFWDFEHHEIIPNSIYMIGRMQFKLNVDRIKHLVDTKQIYVILSNPAEGSETIRGQCNMMGINDYVISKKILILGGGDMSAEYPNLCYDSFMVKIFDYVTNVESSKRINEIYQKTQKPYKFLFLNGRARPHRKFLLEKFKLSGLLNHALWTNLDTGSANCRSMQLIVNDEDLLRRSLDIQYLPKNYEVNDYQHRLSQKPNTEYRFVKNHLFDNTWGEIYLKAEPYIDTYFSLVTETVFDYPHSFRTEKIWKPIAMGHPFVAVSSTGYYRDLHNLGFKTFGNLIDESFDQIENSQQRIQRIEHVVEDLCKQDLAQFLKECYTICKYNQDHLIDMRQQVRSEFPNRFSEFIKKYINERP